MLSVVAVWPSGSKKPVPECLLHPWLTENTSQLCIACIYSCLICLPIYLLSKHLIDSGLISPVICREPVEKCIPTCSSCGIHVFKCISYSGHGTSELLLLLNLRYSACTCQEIRVSAYSPVNDASGCLVQSTHLVNITWAAELCHDLRVAELTHGSTDLCSCPAACLH